jgi:hypothetical protein
MRARGELQERSQGTTRGIPLCARRARGSPDETHARQVETSCDTKPHFRRARRVPLVERRLYASIAPKDFVVDDVPGLCTGRVGTMRRQAHLEFSRQLFRNRQKGWILDDRIPDFTDQLQSLGKRELPDLCDVFHALMLHPASNVPM